MNVCPRCGSDMRWFRAPVIVMLSGVGYFSTCVNSWHEEED